MGLLGVFLGILSLSPWNLVPAHIIFSVSFPSSSLRQGPLEPVNAYLAENCEAIGARGSILQPETIIFDSNRSLYAFSTDGIYRMSSLDGDLRRIVTTNGRPLSGAFVPGTSMLYFVDAALGLLRVDVASESKLNPEIILTHTQDGKPIRFADDIAIVEDRFVYFTDASDIRPFLVDKEYFDIMQPSKLDFLRGVGTGRIIEYDILTSRTRELASGLRFANGITLTADEKRILVAESCNFRILSISREDGSVKVFADNLPGMVDGVKRTDRGTFWATIVKRIDPEISFSLLHYRPFRYFMGKIPDQWLPVKKYGLVIEFDANGSEIRRLHDPTGTLADSISSATEHDGFLYLGTLSKSNHHITRCKLEK